MVATTIEFVESKGAMVGKLQKNVLLALLEIVYNLDMEQDIY
jgi:hypothetical protein